MPCIKCGSKDIQATTAEEVGGMPGLECVRYEKCMTCGYVATVRVNLSKQETSIVAREDQIITTYRRIRRNGNVRFF